MIAEKTDVWRARVGQMVDATSYRGCTATGRLMEVLAGVWGYGGDAVALKLDVKDDRGSDCWPADKCRIAADQTGAEKHPNAAPIAEPPVESESPEAAMRAAFEATYQRNWEDPAGDDMKAIWAKAWAAARAAT